MTTPEATLAAMQGTWLIEQALEAGHAVSQGAATLRIVGTTFARVTPSHVFERTIALRAGANGIMELDLHVTNEPGKGSTLLGIVEIDGEDDEDLPRARRASSPDRVSVDCRER